MLVFVTTLDFIYSGSPQADEVLFFKTLGVSLSAKRSEESLESSANRHVDWSLSIRNLAGSKMIKVDSNLTGPWTEGFLYFQVMSSDQIVGLKSRMDQDLFYRIYFVCHGYFDIRNEYQKLLDAGIDLLRISFLISNHGKAPNLSHKKTVHQTLKNAVYNEAIVVNPQKSVKRSPKKVKNINHFFFVFSLFKFLLTPTYFFKTKLEKLKVSQIVWLLNCKELFLFFYFFVGKMMGLSIDVGHFVSRVTKLAIIRLGYLIRHILLMMGFKSFGILIDLKNWIIEFCKVKLLRFVFSIRHFILMAAFKTFGLLVDIKNSVIGPIKLYGIRCMYLFRHVLLMAGYKTWGLSVDNYHLIKNFCSSNIVKVKVAFIRLIYLIRHVVLISYYKCMGIVIDSYHFTVRNSLSATYPLRKVYWKWEYHLTNEGLLQISIHMLEAPIRLFMSLEPLMKIVLFPFFKLYWFCAYQYKKRIAKTL